MTTATVEPTETGVLVVDDEPAITNLYESWLAEYAVFVAHDGSEALATLERREDEIDVVLLDRKMPGMSGDAVLVEMQGRGYDCRVAMLTAVAPNYDIVEMPFDDYATKPVDGDALRRVVTDLCERTAYSDALSRYYSLVAKHAALTTEHPADRLRENEAFVELETQIRELERDLSDSIDLGNHRSFQYVLREIS